MWKIIANATFTAPVLLTMPGGDPQKVEFEFRHKGRDAIKEWQESAGERTDIEVLDEVIAGWKDGDIGDEHGKAIPYSREALAALLDHSPPAAKEIFFGYLRGAYESRTKN